MSKDNQWNSNLSFILVMIGSAVGLGNIWRYPYILYSNGGGAFYIPYIVAIFMLAISFLILEYGVGYNFKSSFAKSITNINTKLEFYAWFLPVAIFMMTIYYCTIIGWDGIYVVLSFFKGWGANPETYLSSSVLHASTNINDIFIFVPIVAISMIVVWLIIWFISHRNLESGLGKVSKIFVPLLFIITIAIVMYSMTLPGAYLGLNELFKPDWSLLFDLRIWMAAFGQIFFSLSLGMGGAFTFASYTKKDTDLVTNALYVIFANCTFENIAALGVFSILGYISFNSGVPIHDIVSQGTELVFVAYPTVFNILGQVSFIIGPLFFIALYIAAITSILSSFETLSSCVQDKFGISRKRTTTILCIVGGILSMIFATAPGEYLVGVTDTFINSIIIVFSVIIELIVFTWIFNAEKLIGYMNSTSKSIKINKGWLILLKYVIPIILAFIWIGGMYDILTSSSAEYLIMLAILGVILIVSTFILSKIPAKSKEWLEVDERI